LTLVVIPGKRNLSDRAFAEDLAHPGEVTDELSIIENKAVFVVAASYLGNFRLWPAKCHHMCESVTPDHNQINGDEEKLDAETEGFLTN